MGVQLDVLPALQEILAPAARIVPAEHKRAEHFCKKGGAELMSVELFAEPADAVILAVDAAENVPLRRNGSQRRVRPRAAHAMFSIDRQIDVGSHAAFASLPNQCRRSFRIILRKPTVSNSCPIFDDSHSTPAWP